MCERGDSVEAVFGSNIANNLVLRDLGERILLNDPQQLQSKHRGIQFREQLNTDAFRCHAIS